jgi:hypothetical protein
MAKEYVPDVNGHTTDKDVSRNGAHSDNSDHAAAQELEHSRGKEDHAISSEEPAVYEYVRIFFCYRGTTEIL